MSSIKVGMAQIAPVWLNKAATTDKVIDYFEKASDCDLVVFGETLLPGYPFWIGLTDGAQFDSQLQKELHAHYLNNAICIEDGDLETVCKTAKDSATAVYVGVAERPKDRGGHSVYCSLVYIDKQGQIGSVHRKLQPTFEERLTWAPGDGHGLKVHDLEGFTAGGLNCWENWIPLARTALYGMGEDLHIAVWPGSDHNTKDITRFIARESRSFVVSVGSLMRKTDFPSDTPHLNAILQNAPDVLTNGGSCIASPNGEWLVEPIINEEGLFTAELDFDRVLEERQNFDVAGHYSRPDVVSLNVNTERQSIILSAQDAE